MTPDELKNFFNELKKAGTPLSKIPTKYTLLVSTEPVYGPSPLTPLYKNFIAASNCPCTIVNDPQSAPRTEINDLGAKLAAQILLADSLSGIVVPSEEEWIGVNLLERDDELRRKEHAAAKQQTQTCKSEKKTRYNQTADFESDPLSDSQEKVDKL